MNDSIDDEGCMRWDVGKDTWIDGCSDEDRDVRDGIERSKEIGRMREMKRKYGRDYHRRQNGRGERKGGSSECAARLSLSILVSFGKGLRFGSFLAPIVALKKKTNSNSSKIL